MKNLTLYVWQESRNGPFPQKTQMTKFLWYEIDNWNNSITICEINIVILESKK